MNSRNLCNGDYQTSWTIKGHPSLLFERDSQVIFHPTHSTFESFTVYYQNNILYTRRTRQTKSYFKRFTLVIMFLKGCRCRRIFLYVQCIIYTDQQRMRSLIIWSLATTTITNDALFDYWNYKWYFALPTTTKRKMMNSSVFNLLKRESL